VTDQPGPRHRKMAVKSRWPSESSMWFSMWAFLRPLPDTVIDLLAARARLRVTEPEEL
jgi:hypothetical protein